MKKLIVFSIILAMSITFLDAYGGDVDSSVNRGKKEYFKHMKQYCKMTGSTFASKHTQDEWEELYDAEKLSQEIENLCPGYKVKSNLLDNIYDFVYKFASDSGEVPSC